MLDTAAFGPIVINHRIDRFVTARPLTWEGVGVFFVKDGKIQRMVRLHHPRRAVGSAEADGGHSREGLNNA